jgi:hypothetical protein
MRAFFTLSPFHLFPLSPWKALADQPTLHHHDSLHLHPTHTATHDRLSRHCSQPNIRSQRYLEGTQVARSVLTKILQYNKKPRKAAFILIMPFSIDYFLEIVFAKNMPIEMTAIIYPVSLRAARSPQRLHLPSDRLQPSRPQTRQRAHLAQPISDKDVPRDRGEGAFQ